MMRGSLDGVTLDSNQECFLVAKSKVEKILFELADDQEVFSTFFDFLQQNHRTVKRSVDWNGLWLFHAL